MTGPTKKSADVVIIGGGVMGSATAYFLTRLGKFAPGRIVIVERDTSYAECSTGRSLGGLRAQFSTPENIALSKVTLGLVRNLKEHFGPDADVSFREYGYLVLADESRADVLKANHAVQRANGGDIDLLGPDELSREFPWLNVEGLALGAFGRSGEGFMDPSLMMTLFRKSAQAAGVSVIKDTVTGIERAGAKVTGVTLASGDRIDCDTIVCAAGHASGKVAKLAGIDLPVEPRKRFVYVFDCKEATPALHRAPLTQDIAGTYFRPEGRQFLCGMSPGEDEEPAIGDLTAIDHAPFEGHIWPNIAGRIPAFEAIKMTGAWAGYYDYNTLDQNAIIGRHSIMTNLLFCTGFSGHGFQQSGGAGQAIAELIVHGEFRAIDLKRFGYERIERNEPVFELNIY